MASPSLTHYLLILITSGYIAKSHGQVFSVASTKYGPVRGVAVGNGSERIFIYRGIPYAKPPTGNLRLKRPQQPESWSTTKDALHQSYDCMQSPWFGLEEFGVHRNLSEDCLYLNVFSPSSGTNSTLLPVMVWIYGGGFNMGTSSPYDGTALAKKGVVVVTFNYRLDAFGFLSTEDDVIPGNFGLLDQIFALKWVKENIANFGGDPEKVTIFGESAGACSVSILTLSPLTKGLFKRVIMESGSVLSPWCVKYPTSTFPHHTIAAMVGSKVNCSVEPSDHYLQCLQSIDSKELLQASYDVQKASHVELILTPRIEQVFNVLPDLPRRLLDSGHFEHVDSIRGFNSNELALLKENFTHGATLDEVKSDLLPIFLAYTKWPDKGSIVAQIEELYFKNVSDPILTLHRASDVISDFTFVFPALLESISAAGSARNRNNYVYEFSYRKSDSALPDWATSAHADEIIFVFGESYKPVVGLTQFSQDDLAIANEVMTLWTNFAKSGDPTSPESVDAAAWPTFSGTDQHFLQISKVPTVSLAGRQEAISLYRNILTIMETNPNSVVVG